MRSAIASGDDLLEEGSFSSLISMLSCGKMSNVEIEDNFARAAAMRRSGAGRPYSQHGSAARHLLAELRASHQASMKKNFKRVRAKVMKAKKSNFRPKPKPKEVALLQDHASDRTFFGPEEVSRIPLASLSLSSAMSTEATLSLQDQQPCRRFSRSSSFAESETSNQSDRALQLFQSADSLDSLPGGGVSSNRYQKQLWLRNQQRTIAVFGMDGLFSGRNVLKRKLPE